MAAVADPPVPPEDSMGVRPAHYEESRPPWEQSTAQVPYLKSGSNGLTETERQALPELWATHEHEQSIRRKGSRDVTVQDFQDDNRTTMSPDEQEYWRVRTPMTAPPLSAPPPRLPPVPYEAPRISPGPKSAPTLPSFYKNPNSPPYSPPLGSGKSWSSAKSSARSPGIYDPSRASEPSITALPGTMSARERSQSRRRVPRSASVDAPSPKDSKAESPSFGKRLKSAFKDMFKRDPVDDSNLERIEDRHWAEDEY